MDRTRSDRFTPARMLLLSLGLAVAWLVLGLAYGSESARADDGSGSTARRIAVDVSHDATTPAAAVGSVGSPVADAAAPLRKVAPAVPAASVRKVIEISRPVVTPVTKAVVEAVATVPASKPVVAIVAPVAEVVDPVVAPRPKEDIPVVDDIVENAPVRNVTTPVAGVVDEVVNSAIPIVDTTLTNLPALPGAPGVGGPPVPSETTAPPSPVAAAVSQAAVAAPLPTASVPAVQSSVSWAAHLNSESTGASAAASRPHPDPVPRGPADNGISALPNPTGASSKATGGGPSGPVSATVHGSAPVPALLSGALLSHTENDALPSSLALDLASSPD